MYNSHFKLFSAVHCISLSFLSSSQQVSLSQQILKDIYLHRKDWRFDCIPAHASWSKLSHFHTQKNVPSQVIVKSELRVVFIIGSLYLKTKNARYRCMVSFSYHTLTRWWVLAPRNGVCKFGHQDMRNKILWGNKASDLHLCLCFRWGRRRFLLSRRRAKSSTSRQKSPLLSFRSATTPGFFQPRPVPVVTSNRAPWLMIWRSLTRMGTNTTCAVTKEMW